ncbi:MAG: 23S rRNA (guanosine(2251)-2'-O)-methyltransferase RlmB [Bdellovibrionota bacterium]|jgi:23S rRNA (guanosine2251-2'-O)-methyltransferase
MKINPERLVIGKRAVAEVLRSSSERVESVLCAARSGVPEGEVQDLVAKTGIKIKNIRQDELSDLSASDSHQGIAAVLKERRYATLNELIQRSKYSATSLLVMLDGVSDPHNLGAVMRAAECFGADGIIWSKNRGVGITPVVTKTSAGASELLAAVPVSNLADALKKLQAEGFWSVAAALTEDAEPLADFKIAQKTVLILGSEGKGISPLILKLADFVLQVPMEGSISALNVSQAAAVFMYELRRKLNMLDI